MRLIYAAGPGAGLKLTWSNVQDPKYKPIKSIHGIFHQRHEKCVSYVAHSKDLVCSEGTLIHYALQSLLYFMVVTCYCIRAVNSSKIVAQIRTQNFAIFQILRLKFCQNCVTYIFVVKLFSCDQNFSSTMQMQLIQMLTESEYIASVQSIIRDWQGQRQRGARGPAPHLTCLPCQSLSLLF